MSIQGTVSAGMKASTQQSVKKVRKVGLIINCSDDTIREKRGWLMTDNTVQYKNQVYTFSREAVKFVETFPAKLGISNGKIPALFVYEERALPIVFEKNGYRHDSSFALDQFKRMTLASQIVRAAQKENPQDLLKYLILAVLGIGVILMIGMVLMLNAMGIFDGGFLPPSSR